MKLKDLESAFLLLHMDMITNDRTSIHKAWKKRIAAVHPDKNKWDPDAEKNAKLINGAYTEIIAFLNQQELVPIAQPAMSRPYRSQIEIRQYCEEILNHAVALLKQGQALDVLAKLYEIAQDLDALYDKSERDLRNMRITEHLIYEAKISLRLSEGLAYEKTFEWNEAIIKYKIALALLEELNDFSLWGTQLYAKLYNRIGICYTHLNQPYASLEAHENAVKWTGKFTKLDSECIYNLAMAYYQLDQVRKGDSTYRRIFDESVLEYHPKRFFFYLEKRMEHYKQLKNWAGIISCYHTLFSCLTWAENVKTLVYTQIFTLANADIKTCLSQDDADSAFEIVQCMPFVCHQQTKNVFEQYVASFNSEESEKNEQMLLLIEAYAINCCLLGQVFAQQFQFNHAEYFYKEGISLYEALRGLALKEKNISPSESSWQHAQNEAFHQLERINHQQLVTTVHCRFALINLCFETASQEHWTEVMTLCLALATYSEQQHDKEEAQNYYQQAKMASNMVNENHTASTSLWTYFKAAQPLSAQDFPHIAQEKISIIPIKQESYENLALKEVNKRFQQYALDDQGIRFFSAKLPQPDLEPCHHPELVQDVAELSLSGRD